MILYFTYFTFTFNPTDTKYQTYKQKHLIIPKMISIGKNVGNERNILQQLEPEPREINEEAKKYWELDSDRYDVDDIMNTIII